MTTYVHLWYFLAELFLERGIFQKGVVDKSRRHIWVSIIFFPRENSSVYMI